MTNSNSGGTFGNMTDEGGSEGEERALGGGELGREGLLGGCEGEFKEVEKYVF